MPLLWTKLPVFYYWLAFPIVTLVKYVCVAKLPLDHSLLLLGFKKLILITNLALAR